MNKKFFALLTFAFLIRLVSLNQSLWLDEATTARVVQQYNFADIISKFSPGDFHPPLYYLLMKAWTNIFGYSEISLRMPSVIFSLLTGYVVYLIGKRIRNYSIGLWSAAFLLFNPLIIYYSQEARMYMMSTFLLTTALYFYLPLSINLRGSPASLLNRRGSVSVFLFSLSISLSFFTFYGSIFLIISMFIYILYKKRYKEFFVSCFMFIVSCLIISPLLYQQVINAKQQLSLVPNWAQLLGKANLKNLVLIPLKFSIGRISFYPKWFYWVISGAWTIIVWFFLLKGGLKQKLLLFLVIGPLGLGIFFSFFSPLLQYFRFIYLIPLMSILIASGTANLHLRGVNWVVVAGFIVLSMIYLFNPNFHREDWKSLASSLAKEKTIYMIYSASDPMRYYRKDLRIVDLKSADQLSTGQELTVIPYVSDIHGVNYSQALLEKGFIKKSATNFRGVSYETWVWGCP